MCCLLFSPSLPAPFVVFLDSVFVGCFDGVWGEGLLLFFGFSFWCVFDSGAVTALRSPPSDLFHRPSLRVLHILISCRWRVLGGMSAGAAGAHSRSGRAPSSGACLRFVTWTLLSLASLLAPGHGAPCNPGYATVCFSFSPRMIIPSSPICTLLTELRTRGVQAIPVLEHDVPGMRRRYLQ